MLIKILLLGKRHLFVYENLNLNLKFFKVVSAFNGSKGGYFGDLFKCNDLLLKCQGTETITGKYNEISHLFNQNCSQEIGSKWSNITRCELEAVKCLGKKI